MYFFARAFVLVALLLFAASCSDSDERLTATQPSLVGKSLVSVNATSPTVVAQAVSGPSCPSVAPFNVPLSVVVRATGSSDVILTGIRLVFTDTSGRQAPQVTLPLLPVTLPAPGPTLQFGSARTFPLILGIGCDTGVRGTVVIIVETSDDRGRRGSNQVSVAVR